MSNISDEAKVELASWYMTGKADKSITSYLVVREDMFLVWNEFIMDLTARFRDDDGEYAVEQFHRLTQIDSF